MSPDNTPLPPLPPYIIVFGPKANCTLDLCPVEYSVYGYRPSLAANVTFIALYSLAVVIHAYLGVRWKQWWFMGCVVVGGLNAIIGYIGRCLLYLNPFNFVAFMIQIICINSSPVYYCAAIYFTLSTTITHLSPHLSRFRPNLFYYIFIPCDLFSLVLQGAGGALSVASSGTSQIGVNLALVGLSFQVFTICLFCGFFGDYLIRYYQLSPQQRHREARTKTHGIMGMGRMKLYFGFMGTAIILTVARCAYRLAEMHAGYTGDGSSMIRDEGLFIGLEGVLILAAVYCLLVGHPGLVFGRGDEKESLDGHELIGTSTETDKADGRR
ncbi:parasitic phase-specific protein PSP-1 [Apodospora peruviana]|uniref:Parasitic phase-specific protein PSP-1 n=1 Tax=Apodospora peruviana TaxID=516989 RepID=A0AAE0M0Y4_9PEZI|nr:parasitic phase-specific protein PSP-1 [Apodospora peruviana]